MLIGTVDVFASRSKDANAASAAEISAALLFGFEFPADMQMCACNFTWVAKENVHFSAHL